MTTELDAEETPQSRHRKKLAKQNDELRKMKDAPPKDEWYEIVNGKVIKVMKTASGNTCRRYQCNNDKKNKDFVDKLKAKGLIRI